MRFSGKSRCRLTSWLAGAFLIAAPSDAWAFGTEATIFFDDQTYPHQAGDGTVTTHWSDDGAGNPVSRYELNDDTHRLERALADLAVARQSDPDACLGISGTYHISRTLYIDDACIIGNRGDLDHGFVLKAARKPDGSHGFVPHMLAASAPFKLQGVTIRAEDFAWGIGIYDVNGPEITEIRDTKVRASVGAGIYAFRSSKLALQDAIVTYWQGGGFVLYESNDIRLTYPKAVYGYGEVHSGCCTIYSAAIGISGDHPRASGQITILYPYLEQNHTYSIYVTSRTQPVDSKGGWLEGNRGHNAWIDDSQNVQIRYGHFTGSSAVHYNGFHPRNILLSGESVNNTLEYNYFFKLGAVRLGWYTDANGVDVATDWTANTLRNWQAGELSNEVSVLFTNRLGTADPALEAVELGSPGDRIPRVTDRDSCGDGVTTAAADEECDDGNYWNDDGCGGRTGDTPACTGIETCGDGKVQNRFGGLLEECDSSDPTRCNTDCTETGVSDPAAPPSQPTSKPLEVDVFSTDYATLPDDDARLDAALGDAGATGCVVGEGTLTITRTIRPNALGYPLDWGGQIRCLKGRGPTRRLVIVADVNGPWPASHMLKANGGRSQLQHVDFDANGRVDYALRYDTALRDRLVDVNVRGALKAGFSVETGNGMVIRNVTSQHNGGAGAVFSDMNAAFVENLTVKNNGDVGLDITGYNFTRDDKLDPCKRTFSGGMYLGGFTSQDNGSHGLAIRGTTSPVVVDGALIQRNAGHGVDLHNLRNAVLVDSEINGPPVAGPPSPDSRAVFVSGRVYGTLFRDNEVRVSGSPTFAAIEMGEYPDRGEPAHYTDGVYHAAVLPSISSIPPDWNEFVGNTDPSGNPLPESYGNSPYCPTNTTATEVVIFDTGIDSNGDLGGRGGADALALGAAPGAALGTVGAGGNDYQVMALLSTRSYSLLDAAQRACIPDNVPVVGYVGATATQLASDWYDFVNNYHDLNPDVALDDSFEAALGIPASTQLWTGSEDDAIWNVQVDCCNWSSSSPDELGSVSDPANLHTAAWPYGNDAACDQSHRLLGVAWNVD